LEYLSLLTPEGLSGWSSAVLILMSSLTSAMTAAFGIGGGLTMIAVMIPLVPIHALVPVHGLVQLGSNGGRAILQVRHARWDILALFATGAVVGALIGGMVVVDVPAVALKLGVGVFILWSVWGKMPAIGEGNRVLLALGGGMSTLLSMFVGATGPFVMALYAHAKLTKEQLVATFAGSMVMQHCLKVLAFGALGFAFGDWLPLAVAMIVAGFIGTVLGTRVLRRLPERIFRMSLKILLTLIGIQLVLSAGARLLD